AGEWNGFSATAQPLSGPDGNGAYQVTLRLQPGLYAYKLVLDGTDWELDAQNSYRKYAGGVENSGLRVADCHVPSLQVEPGTLQLSRPAAGQGELVVRVRANAAIGASPGLCALHAEVRGDQEPPAAPPPVQVQLSADGRYADLRMVDLPDGKYTLAL